MFSYIDFSHHFIKGVDDIIHLVDLSFLFVLFLFFTQLLASNSVPFCSSFLLCFLTKDLASVRHTCSQLLMVILWMYLWWMDGLLRYFLNSFVKSLY